MTQSTFTYKYSVGSRRETKYEIGVRHDPNMNEVESFAVILFFSLEDGTRVEVIKIDDSEHDGVNEDAHIDRYYRELEADVKDFDPDEDIDKWVDAEDYVKDDWKEFADRYFRNHGGEPRADRVNVGSR